MWVHDPVCGMRFRVVQATAVVKHRQIEYYFCADRCRKVFEADPERFIRRAEAPDLPSVTDGDDLDLPAGDVDPASKYCPFCGTSTDIPREPESDLAAFSLAELEAMVHNEWRRRLGRSAYERNHPISLIRALVAFGRDPMNPDRSAVVDEEIGKVAVALATWGLNQRQIQGELFRLSQAIWDVLSWTDDEFERSRELMEPMDRKLMATLVSGRMFDAGQTTT